MRKQAYAAEYLEVSEYIELGTDRSENIVIGYDKLNSSEELLLRWGTCEPPSLRIARPHVAACQRF